MSVQTAMFMTVGASLIDNIRKKRIAMPSCDGKFVDSQGETLEGADARVIIQALYQECFGNLTEELNGGLKSASFPAAEVQSLCYWLAEQEKETVLTDIILLPTKGKPAPICADKLKSIFVEQVFKSQIAQPYVPPNEKVNINVDSFQLRFEDKAHFAADIADFLNRLKGHLEFFEKQDARVVFNITGGYKGLTPIFSLFGFLFEDIEVIYQHEEGDIVLRVPALPLAWDFKLFDEYRSLVRGAVELAHEPPAKFGMLFEKTDGKWTKNPFSNVLEDIYTKDRLKRFGYGARLIRRLPRGMQEQLLPQVSIGGIYRWEHIWMGDQIPETVEHSRGHSLRLMEYAASLLEPRFARHHDFLTDDELYCLICCLWLHDIGHTALNYYLPDGKVLPIAQFPTLVRDYHHLLSYQRIRDEGYDYLPAEEREAIALISKYHRGKMPLTGKKWEEKGRFGHAEEPMEDIINGAGLDFRKTKITKEKALLLCALLKFIDGLDMQSDRVIDENYWRERKQRTKEEVDYYHELLSRRLAFLNNLEGLECSKNDSFIKLWMNVDELYDKIKTVYQQWTQLPDGIEEWEQAEAIADKIENVEPCLIETIRDALYLNMGEERELFLEILSLLDKVGFKMKQQAHFRMHSRIKLVYLTYHENPGISYRIQMVFDPKYSTTDEQKLKLANEIAKEVERVGDIFTKHGIFFEGVFDEGVPLLPMEGDTA